MTLAEDRAASTADRFGVSYRVDEHDCLAFAQALRARGADVCFVNWDDVDFEASKLRRVYHSNRGSYLHDVSCAAFDAAFLYKMEGFLREQTRFFAMVAMFEASCARVINDPATIRHNIDKHYLLELGRHGIPIIPTYRLAMNGSAATGGAASALTQDSGAAISLAGLIDSAHDRGESIVLKPWRGERGDAVVRLDAHAPRAAWHDVVRNIDPSFYLAQTFMPTVRAGERSLAFIGHAFQHAVIKFPNPRDPDEFRCNESLGGTVQPYRPTDDELTLAGQILRSYEALGYPVHFSRIDLIDAPQGPMLMEAELLNPSIYANYLGRGQAFSAAFADYVLTLLRS